MNRILFAIVMLLLSVKPALSSAQQGSTDSIAAAQIFAKGIAQYNKKNLDSAIILFKEIAENNMARGTSVFGNALYNIPTIYWQMSKIREAKMWYLMVLASDVKDNDETGSIMEPHANYKYKSAVSMANICALDSNYTEMLNWLYKADTVYPYWGFEGSATNVNQRQAYLLDSKVKALLGLGKKEEAIREIITTLIYAGSEHFFSTAAETLTTLTEKTSFINHFDEALDMMVVTTADSITWLASFEVMGLRYELIFSKDDRAKKIPHFWHRYFVDKDVEIDSRAVKALILRTKFYKSLASK